MKVTWTMIMKLKSLRKMKQKYQDQRMMRNPGKMDMFNEDDKLEQRMSSFERAKPPSKTKLPPLKRKTLNPPALGPSAEKSTPPTPLRQSPRRSRRFRQLVPSVPQITEERTEEIEDVIKRRIGGSGGMMLKRKDGRI